MVISSAVIQVLCSFVCRLLRLGGSLSVPPGMPRLRTPYRYMGAPPARANAASIDVGWPWESRNRIGEFPDPIGRGKRSSASGRLARVPARHRTPPERGDVSRGQGIL